MGVSFFRPWLIELNYVIVRLFMEMGAQGWNVPLLALAPDHTDHDFFFAWEMQEEKGMGLLHRYYLLC